MRLIDADKLMERISSIENPDMLTIGKVVGTIDTEPTAYDIDKVVEELENKCISPNDHYGYVVDLEKAIEIVEQGVK